MGSDVNLLKAMCQCLFAYGAVFVYSSWLMFDCFCALRNCKTSVALLCAPGEGVYYYYHYYYYYYYYYYYSQGELSCCSSSSNNNNINNHNNYYYYFYYY